MRKWRVALVTVVSMALLLAGLTGLTGCAQQTEAQINAAFSAWPASGSAPLEVDFYDQSTGDIEEWGWDFDNDSVVDSTEQYPSCTYDVAGTYTVALTVAGPEGSVTQTRTDYVQVAEGTSDGEPASVSDDSATEETLLYLDTEIGVELDTTELVQKVGAAVVSIVTTTITYDWRWRPVPSTGAGTGIIINSEGWIVTNNHVVEDAQTVTVILSDGRSFEASSVISDPETDLALVRIGATGLPYLHFLVNSLEQLNELDPVIAVGNALALPGGPTWTTGVVSNLGRSIDLGDGVILSDVIQTDAAINQGNSGGPLVNTAGQVVGINVAIASNSENIGFAISTDTAIPVIGTLIAQG
ncbi:MAG: hypothetical protein A2Y72_00715 [Chloroflexi bacterium RBG_13_53_26]|nr:MAG: hypothetical protein A2Y72_00715 [Chloroflexi bacterium RBG_13_53_26]